MDLTNAVTTYGDPRNPPILFLHGIRLGARIWEPHARALSDEFFVVAPDLPGHGRLAHLRFDIPVYEEMLAQIAASLSTPPVIVGYSLGGYAAMRYALAAPERSAGLILTGCSTDIVGPKQALYELAVGAAAQIPEQVMDRLLALFFRVTLPARVADLIIPFPFNYRVFADSRRTAVGVRYSEKLRTYEKPLLVVNGEWDILFRPDEVRFCEPAHAELRVMRGTDHVAPLRRPEEFSGIVRGFARRVFHALGASPTGPIS